MIPHPESIWTVPYANLTERHADKLITLEATSQDKTFSIDVSKSCLQNFVRQSIPNWNKTSMCVNVFSGQ